PGLAEVRRLEQKRTEVVGSETGLRNVGRTGVEVRWEDAADPDLCRAAGGRDRRRGVEPGATPLARCLDLSVVGTDQIPPAVTGDSAIVEMVQKRIDDPFCA